MCHRHRRLCSCPLRFYPRAAFPMLSSFKFQERFGELQVSRTYVRNVRLLPAEIDVSIKCDNFRGRGGVRLKGSSASSFGGSGQVPAQPNLTVVCRECLITTKAKEDVNDTNETPEHTERPQHADSKFVSFLSLPDFWLQVAIAIFTAGFLDAGFSGDWSRIGVVSKEVEAELQMAAVGVVPLAALLIWSISQQKKNP